MNTVAKNTTHISLTKPSINSAKYVVMEKIMLFFKNDGTHSHKVRMVRRISRFE